LSDNLTLSAKEEWEQKKVDFHKKYTPDRLSGKPWVEAIHTLAKRLQASFHQNLILLNGISNEAYDCRVEVGYSDKKRVTFKVDGVRISKKNLIEKLTRTLYYPREVLTWKETADDYHFCKTSTDHLLEVRKTSSGWSGVIIAGENATTEPGTYSICKRKNTLEEVIKSVESAYRDLEDE